MTSTPISTPNLQHIATLRAYVSPDVIRWGSESPGHVRTSAPITGGFLKFTTEEIEAEIVPPSWPVTESFNGHAHLNVQCRAKTDAGEISIQYAGVLDIDEATTKAAKHAPDAKSTSFGETRWFTTISFRTSDQRLKWLQDSVFVGQGRVHLDDEGNAAEYLIYKLS
jgi:hypothetical protein